MIDTPSERLATREQLDIATAERDRFRAHTLELLGILRRQGGFMRTEDQRLLRAAQADVAADVVVSKAVRR